MSKYISDSERSDYGDDFLDVVGRKAKEIAEPHIQALQAEVQSLRGQVARKDRNAMMEALDRDEGTKNWRQINEDSRFLQALEGRDEYSGEKYITLLKSAWDRNDFQVVKSYFKKAQEDMRAPSSQFPPVRRADGSLDRGLATSRDNATMTRAQIAQFHRDVAAGKYKGREKEKDAFDRAMVEAARTGRIL
jgi:hypothetical protein